MDTYERVVLVKPEIFVFNIPPRASNRGYRFVIVFALSLTVHLLFIITLNMTFFCLQASRHAPP